MVYYNQNVFTSVNHTKMTNKIRRRKKRKRKKRKKTTAMNRKSCLRLPASLYFVTVLYGKMILFLKYTIGFRSHLPSF